jgi:hypothetical protein
VTPIPLAERKYGLLHLLQSLLVSFMSLLELTCLSSLGLQQISQVLEVHPLGSLGLSVETDPAEVRATTLRVSWLRVSSSLVPSAGVPF